MLDPKPASQGVEEHGEQHPQLALEVSTGGQEFGSLTAEARTRNSPLPRFPAGGAFYDPARGFV